MPLVPVEAKSGLIPIESKKPNPELDDGAVAVDTFGAGEDKFLLSTPEQRNTWLAEGPEGWWEYGTKTLFSDIYYGQVAGTGSLVGLVGRLRDDEYTSPERKEADEQTLYDVMLRKEESMIRGSTWGKNVYRVVANIPSFALEFAATKGLASVTRAALTKTAAVGAKKLLVTKAAKVLAREAVVGAVRTTVLPHRALATYGQKSLNEHLAITDKGIRLTNEAAEQPVITFMKAYGDTFVEFYSETMGGELFKPIGNVATRGILKRLPKATKEVFTKIAEAISKKIPKGKIVNLLSKGGFDGLVEEYGEERFGALLKTIIGVDDRDISTMDKLQEAVFPGWEQASIEIGAFAIYGGMGASSQMISNHLTGKGVSQKDISKVLDNLNEKEKDELSLKLNEPSPEGRTKAELIVKAASGEELTPKEAEALDTLHKEFVDKGLIKVKEDKAEVTEALTTSKTPIVEPLIAEAKKFKTAAEFVAKQPAKDEIVDIVNKHPLVENKENIKDVYIVGSFAKGELKPGSDIDIVLVVDGVKGMTEQDLTRKYRKKIQQYFVDKDIKGIRDDLHPQVMGRRADIYYKYTAPEKGIKITETKSQLTDIWNKAQGKEKTPIQQKAQEVINANDNQTADIKKKISLLYQGREKQLDQRRVAIEKEMTLLEKQRDMLKKDNKPIKAIENKLKKLDKEWESIHYQIADLEDTGIARLEKEGITIKGEELERLRGKAFRRGEVTIRKDLMAKIKAQRTEKATRGKAAKTVLKAYKKPSNIIDIQYQKQIDGILNKLGDKKQTRKKSLNKMTTGELIKLADVIADLKETGKKVFKTKKDQAKVASEIMRGALIKQAGGTKEGMFSKGSTQEKKAKRSTLLKVADIITMRPLRMIRRLLGDIGESLIYNSIDNADMQRGINAWARKKQINQAMEDNKVTFWGLGKLIDIDGKSYQVNNILRMYLATKDAKSYAALLHGNNITEGEVTAFINSVKAEYPSYIKFADDAQKIVANRTNEYFETAETYYNISPEKVDIYFPLRRIGIGGISQEELNEGLETEMVQEQVLRKGAGFKYTSVDKKSTISRKEIDDKFQPEISLDFIGDAIKAIEKQEHLIAYAPLQKSFNKIINDPDLQNAIKYNHGQASWKWLNDYLLTNINPDLMFQGSNWIERYVNRVLKPARLGLSKAYLGFNAVTALKQFPSLTLAMKYTTPKALGESMTRITNDKAREEIYKLDPSLKNRVVSRDFNDLLKGIEGLPEGDIKRALLVASKAIDKKAFAMIMNMDRYAVLSVYDAVYRHQSKTKSQVEAKNLAHKAVIETQPQGGVKDLPTIYRTNNEFLRLGLMFTNQLNQIWNMTRADMPREVAKGEYGKAVTGIASIIVSSTLIYIMSHGRLPEDPGDFFDAIFGSSISSVPIIGNLGMAYLRGYEPSISPVSAIMNNLKYMKSNIDSGDYLKAMEKASFVSAVWLQLPYSQPRRTIKGIVGLATGETTDFRRLLWSEFMLENQ